MSNRRVSLVATAVVSVLAAVPALAAGDVGHISYPGTPNPPDSSAPIESFSWGLSNSGAGSGGGHGSGKVSFHDLSFTSPVTKGTARLAYLGATGKFLKTVEIDTDASADGSLPVTYCLSNALVRRIRLSNLGSSGEDGTSVAEEGVAVDLAYQRLQIKVGIAIASFNLTTNTFSFSSATKGGGGLC